jgi:hypothetical protein
METFLEKNGADTQNQRGSGLCRLSTPHRVAHFVREHEAFEIPQRFVDDDRT